MTDKTTLRKQILQNRTSSSSDDTALTAQFLSIFPPSPDSILSFFWPMLGEPDTRQIAAAYHASGAKCVLPCVRTDGVHGLIFREWTPDTPLLKTKFGTLEPARHSGENRNPATPPNEGTETEYHPTHMLIPMLMADTHGNRLGRGAGHYDATLATHRPPHAIGIIYDHQLYAGTLPAEPHDQPLDMLITPTQILRFKTA